MEKCNLCGQDLDFWDKQLNFSVDRRIGYGSKYDGDQIHIKLCCQCLDNVIDKCKIIPLKEDNV